MKGKRSISELFRANTLSFSILASLVIGSVTIGMQYLDFKRNTAVYEKEHVARSKNMLITDVAYLLDFIRHERSTITDDLKKDLKEKIGQAYSIAMSLYEDNKDRLPEGEIKRLIVDTLNDITFYDGRGYYFIHDLDHHLVMNRNRPDRIGKSDIDLTDLTGKKIVKSFINIGITQGEGYDHYYWNKPGGDVLIPKLSYLKLFRPYGWVIGTGEYLDGVEQRIQKGILDRMGLMSFQSSALIRIIDFGGTVVFDPGGTFHQGESLLSLKDGSGRLLVTDLLGMALTPMGGSGVIEMPSGEDGAMAKYLFHARTVPGWGWVVVATVPLKDMDQVMFQHRESLRRSMLAQAVLIAFVLSAAALILVLVSRRISRKVQTEFDVIAGFFGKVADGGQPIDVERLSILELISLAGSANAMQEKLAASRLEILRKTAMLEEEVAVRSRAESELVVARDLFQVILDSMPSVVVAVDQFGMVTHVNRTAAKVFEVSAPDCMGKPVGEVIPAMAGREDLVERTLRDGEPARLDRQTFHICSEDRLIDILVYPMASDGLKGAVVRLDDVTEKAGLEDMLIQTEKIVSLGGLAAGMAHEINNPLSGILQGSQVVIRRLDPATPASLEAARSAGIDPGALTAFLKARSIPDMLEGVRQSAERASRIVADMLEFSRKSSTVKIPSDMATLCDKALLLCEKDYSLAKKYDFKRITIIRDYNPDLPKVLCTPLQIEQVLVNIIRNAAHALASRDGGEPPRITVRTGLDNGYVRIQVEDNGPGMDEAKRRRIFEPFYSSKSPGEGTGLGLSVSFFIITRNHGGILRVESQEGRGSVFSVLLPLEESAIPRELP